MTIALTLLCAAYFGCAIFVALQFRPAPLAEDGELDRFAGRAVSPASTRDRDLAGCECRRCARRHLRRALHGGAPPLPPRPARPPPVLPGPRPPRSARPQ